MKIVKQWLARQKQSANRPASRVAASPLLLALEPRVVYDASVAAIAAQPHAHQHAPADADTHRTETQTEASKSNATTNAPPVPVDKPVRGAAARNTVDPAPSTGADAGNATDVKAQQGNARTTNDITAAMPAAMQTQVVFIDPSVANYQTLIDGLPAGTQYVVLDASTDGFAQIAQYLQSHHGVESISLISHGADGGIQAGSTWLNASDLSAYSAQLAQIGAAMNAGGDFLIYGCDVAQQADGRALVQQIADITHLNVAASVDATGSSSLGGNWTLEYAVGAVHSALNESASALAQFDGLLAVTTETYDAAATAGFRAVGQSQFTLDGITYTLDQVANNYALNSGGSDLINSPGDGILSLNDDGGSLMRNVTISLASGQTFNLQQFDLSSFNGDLYIQANYANGTHSAAIQLATAAVGGFGPATVQSELGTAFNNIVSFSLIDMNDTGSFEPQLDNLIYQANGPAVTPSSGSATWVSSDNGTGGTPVAVDSGITLADPGSATLTGATITIGSFQSGDVLNFTAQNGISASYSGGVLTLFGSATVAQYQTALQSITFDSSLTSPALSTTTRAISYTITDGTATSAVATRSITITATDQTPLVTEGGAASTSYVAGNAAVVVDSNLHVSDADTPKLPSGTVTIGSGFQTGDTLAFNNSNATLYGNITGSYLSGTLTLTSLNSTATAAQWQNAFEAVTFASAAGTTAGIRDITFSVSDGTKSSALLHHSVNVTVGPKLTTDSGSAAFVSGDNTTSTPVAVDAGITVTDGNSATLTSATVSITGNFQINHDELVFIGNPSTMGNISGVYDSGTGVLTLTSAGGASLAQWQNALRSISFTNDLVTPSTATRTVSYQINDGSLTSAVATRTVAVTATDQTPVLGAGGNTAAFVAGDNAASTAVAVNNAITVGDLDGGPLQQAVISITAHYEATDVLAFNNNNTALYGNISATYVNGVLTLSSSGNQATLAQWQNALRAVTYNSTAVTPGNSARTVSFTVNDGTKTSTAATSTVTVTDTDQTPIIHGSSGNATFTQGDNVASAPIVIDPAITLSDLDNTTLTQARVVISTGYDANGDFLLFTNNGSTMGNITGSYSNGVLVLTSQNGSATLAQWQAALRSITYTDAASSPSTTQRVMSFSVSDGVKTSASFNRSVNIVLTEQSPVVTDTGGTVTFTSADNAPSTPIVVDAGVTLTDSDSATMASATVRISGNYQSGEDVLALGSGAFGDIQANFNAGTGTLTLTSAGASTIAQWQAALRSVTYTDTAAVPQTANRTISFSANDGTKTSIGSSKVIAVNATHQTPVLGASNNSLTYLPGQAATSIDSGITLTDLNVSGSTLVSMTITVQITSGMQSGDTLGFSLPTSTLTNGMNINYDGTTGTLTISSTGGTLSQWRTVLDNVQFSTAAGTPLGSRTLGITISDGVKTSAPINYSVNVVSSDPAINTTSTGSVSFVAGDNASSTPVAVDPNLTVADPLGNVVDSAVVAITGNLHSGEDQLQFVNDGLTMGNITGNYNSLTGTLTLISSNGSATLAQWQAALRSVTYTDTLVTPNTATRTVSFAVNAGPQFSNVITRNITVTDTDQTPLLSTSSTGSAAFVAGDNVASTPVAIDTHIVVADLDTPTLSTATVQIGTGFQAGEDVLGFINDGLTMGNITAAYDAVHGTLTLTSAGSSATQLQWQNALRAVTYTDTAITPNSTQRSIQFTINDGTKSSTALTRTVSVTDTDQTPVISTGSTGSAAFVAGDNVASTPVAVDNGITLSDLDNTTLASAVVQIGAGFHAGEDVLSFTNDGTMGNITGVYNPAIGVLTLISQNHSATLAQWQAALRSITYLDTAITPNTTTRTVNFTVSDNVKTSAAYSRNVTVAAADQTPVISSSSTGSAAFVAADNAPSTPVAIDSGIALSDRDNTTLASATVQIGTGFQAGEDVLTFVNDGTMGNITASYDAVHGTLTLSSSGATATIAQWQAALRAVAYTDTAVTPTTATRTIGFTINDGTKSSTAYTRTVTVADTDQTPLLSSSSTGSAAFAAGDNTVSTPVAIDSGITVADLDNTTLASATVQIGAGFRIGEDVLGFINNGTMGNITASYDAVHGTLTLSSAGATATLAQWQAALRAVTYTDTAITPNTATRTISFTVNDGTKTSVPITRNVSVADTDQTPIIGSTTSGAAAFVSADNGPSTPIAVDTGIVLSDLDNSTLASATVTIGTGFHAGEDVLGFTNNGLTMGNITASYDATTGTLTLTSFGASATLLQWQNALRSVTYVDTAVSPDTATRTIAFAVNDNVKTSEAYSRNVSVTATDQTPLISSSSTGSAAFTAGDNVASTPVAIDTRIVLSDADNTTLASATVQIGTGFHAGEDVLSFANDGTMGNITGSYNAATGTLTLTSAGNTATLAQFQAALRSVTYTDTAITPNTATRTIGFSVNDGTKSSTAITRTVTVSDVDQTPIISSGSAGAASFVAGDNVVSTPVAIDTGITLADLDNTTFASATVQIGAGFHAGEDVLSFVNDGTMGNITGSYNALTGTLTLTSLGNTATLAQFQAALRSVTYTDTAVTPDTTTRTIGFKINDGVKTSAVYSRNVSVAATDQTPTIASGSIGSASFVAGDNVASTPIVIDNGITLSDRDNTTFASATVQIGAGFHAGEDVLSFVNDGTMGNITGSYNALTGTLTLTSAGNTATLAQFQAALRSVTYTDTAITPNSATRTISFVVNDGTKASSAITRTVTVTDVDQTPVITSSNTGSASFVAGDNVASTPIAVDNGITLSDRDNTTFASATVQIGAGFHAGEDVLSFVNDGTMGNITGSYNALTGTLTLTSLGNTATLAQFQAALRSVTYTDTAVTPDTTTRTIGFKINDGVKTSAVYSRNVSVAATDQTPTIASGSIGSASFVAGDNVASTPIVIDNGITLSDRDNTTFASATVQIGAGFHGSEDMLAFVNDGTMGNITGSYNALTGTLTLTSLGGTATLAQFQAALRSVTYTDTAITPNSASRIISFSVSDGTKASSAITRTVTVTDVDQTPIISSGSTGSASFVAGDNVTSTPVVIDNGITLSDRDNTTFASATVQIGAGFLAGEDVLAFVNDGTMGNIAGSYNPLTGTLTLTSLGNTATLAQFQAALRSVTYTDTAITPNAANRTISFSVNDGVKTSAAITRTVTVTDVDQTPIISSGSIGSASFVAGDNVTSTPIAIDNGITLSDRDNTTFASATVQIGAGFHAGEDVLAFANDGATMGNITASYNASTGTLTLTSAGNTATLAQFQAALRSVTYTDTAITPATANRTLIFSVNDGVKTSAAITRTVTVTDVDQTPIISSGSIGSASFVAGDNVTSTPIAIDNGITLSDRDNTTFASATVQIGAGFHAGEDVLAFANDGATMGNITASYNASTGTLTLTSAGNTATLAQFQAALRSVTYTDTAITPATANRTLIFSVNDGVKTSAAITRTVTVTDVDQTPIISSGSIGSASFVAGDNVTSTPIAIDNGITLSDRDNTTFASATVQIGAGFHAGEDVLAFANDGATMGNITASYNASTGTLTLTSAGNTATLAQFQAALRSVTYTDTAITPATANRTLIFSVNDGVKTSPAITRTVTVTDVDQTPIITSGSTGSASFVAGDNVTSTPIVIDNGIALSDRDNTTFASATVQIGAGFHAGEDVLAFANDGATMGNITASYNASTGTLTLTSAGNTATLAQFQAALRSVTYTDTAITPATANRTLIFSVNDGVKTSPAITRTVTVTDVDQTPIITSGSTGSASFVAGDNVTSTPIVIDNGIALSDRDNSTFVSATVQIGTGFHAGQDVLGFTNDGATMGNITASYNAATGTLTLTSAGGIATLAQFQAALRSVTYTDTAVTPDTASRAISFSVNDGVKTSAVLTRNVTVTATHQSLLLNSDGTQASYKADGKPSHSTDVGAGITLTDLNDTPPTVATVAFSGSFDAQHDVLGLTPSAATGDITASYDATRGVLTLSSASGTATAAQWQAALAAVSYRDTQAERFDGTRTLVFTVGDGVKTSAPLTRTLQITAANAVGTAPLPQWVLQPLEQQIERTAAPLHDLLGGASLLAANTLGGFDGVSNSLIVLDAFDPRATGHDRDVGTIAPRPTFTFATHDARSNSLGDTFVKPLDSLVPPSLDATQSAAHLLPAVDVHPLHQSGQGFALNVRPLLHAPGTVAAPNTVDTAVTLADGAPLPAWLHYDATTGVLSGTPPAGVHEVRVTLIQHDASGNLVRREVVMRLDAHGNTAAKPPAHDAKPQQPPAPQAALPAAKASLAAQFANALATLHVSPDGAVAPAAAHTAALNGEHRA
ncbi:MAG: DUF4347 domain-containing protein [Burkholderia sp.]